ncbi:MAG TPA: hypothetical protein VMS74_12530 [Acidimicrobiia bacterium]|nr:hypothetical protein [Acidimicrobiia bacterium]
MDSRKRLVLASTVGALLFSVGYLLVLVIPGGGTTAEADFTAFYVGRDSFFDVFLLFLALVGGAWALVWFFTELSARIPESTLRRVGYAASLIGAAGLSIGGALLFAPVGVQMNSAGSAFVGSPIAHTLAQAGLGTILVAGMYSFALAVGLFSIALRRSGLVPSWLAIAGIVVAVLMLGSYIWVPGYLLPVWMVVLGVVGVRGHEAFPSDVQGRQP